MSSQQNSNQFLRAGGQTSQQGSLFHCHPIIPSTWRFTVEFPSPRIRKTLLLFLLVLLEAAIVQAAESRGIRIVEPLKPDLTVGNAALFVGVGTFEPNRGLPDLRYTVDDAVAFAHFLVIDLKLIPIRHARISISGPPSQERRKRQLEELKQRGLVVTDATRRTIFDLVDEITSKVPVNSNSMVLISFATHGHEKDGVSYIMPSDGDIKRVVDYGVSLRSVQEDLKRCTANKKILIVDACRETVETRSVNPQPVGGAFLAALRAAEGTALISSCSSGELSWEDHSFGHGVFMHYFLEGLGGKADVRGEYVTLGTASQYAARKVMDWTRERNRAKQEPRFDGELAREIPFGFARPQTDAELRVSQAIERLQEATRFQPDLQQPIDRVCVSLRQNSQTWVNNCMLAIASLEIADRAKVEKFISDHNPEFEPHIFKLTHARSLHTDLADKILEAQNRYLSLFGIPKVNWQMRLRTMSAADRIAVRLFLEWSGVMVVTPPPQPIPEPPPPPPPPPPLGRFRVAGDGTITDSETGFKWFLPHRIPISGDAYISYMKEAKKSSKWRSPDGDQLRKLLEGPPGASTLPREFGLNAPLVRIWLDWGAFSTRVFHVPIATEGKMTSSDFAYILLVGR